MAVTVTSKRIHETYSQKENRLFIQYGLAGTYATGGFVTPFTGVAGAPGSSPVQSKNPIVFDWYSPTGYIYSSTITTAASGVPTVTTKIFSAPGTELANGTAVPDATILASVDALRY